MPRSGRPPARSIGTPGAGASAAAGRRRGEPLVDDRVAGQGARPGSRASSSLAVDDRDVAVVGDPADHRDRQAPALADRATSSQRSGRTIASIRSCDSEIITSNGSMPGSRRGIAVEVDPHPGPRPVGGLGRGAGDPAGAEVLEPLDEPALDQLERRLDQELLGERVADLDAGPLRGVVVAERRAGEDARPADPVAAGRRAEQHDEVARARARPRA